MEGTSMNSQHLSMKFDLNKANVGGDESEEELQLSLGLSMNGTFGVDPASKKLKRSSSTTYLGVSGAVEVAREEHAPLVRALSVPVDNEEEMRRRKADQTAKRLEVRKKMNWKKSARENNNNNNININININNNIVENVGNVEAIDQVVNEGPVGSQKSGSSGVSDQQIEGATQNGEEKSPSSVPSVEIQVDQAAPAQANAPARNGAPGSDGMRNTMLVGPPLFDMPYVSTRGGENMVSGFLYKYGKGEDLKIVCVCHGLFLSPAEFVRHGGGGDVENPLKHIIVNTTPLF